MIVFDLRCADCGHVFEGWFGSSAAFADQSDRGLIACPLCTGTDVAKAVMAPNIGAKGNRAPVPADPRAKMRAAVTALAVEQAKALETSQWVGEAFPERARAMHDGTEPEAQIHGRATLAEARALVDDGVPVAPLLVPVVPPEARN